MPVDRLVISTGRDNPHNGDGKADILLRDSGGTLEIWITSGATISPGASVGAPGSGYTAY